VSKEEEDLEDAARAEAEDEAFDLREAFICFYEKVR
jgi:hypothetical protein